jgi:hypothetical protein
VKPHIDKKLTRTDFLKRGSLQAGKKGWTGISHGGGMTNALLLVGWADADAVKTTFLYTGYVKKPIAHNPH